MPSMVRQWVLIVAVVVAAVVVAALLLASVLYDGESCPIPDPDPLGKEIDMSEYEEILLLQPHIEKYIEPTERARAIRHKYEDLFWRQPNVHGVGIGAIEDENGEETEQTGFRIYVTEKVDQNTLSPEDRIPDCLEGVPVQIIEQPNDAILLMGMTG